MVPRSGYTTAAASTQGGATSTLLDLNTSLLPHRRAVSPSSPASNSTLRRTSTAPAPRPWAISLENTRLFTRMPPGMVRSTVPWATA